MALITTGGKISRDLETHGALGVYIPLEGGFEGRYRRRLRSRGYVSTVLSARGLGDVGMYLTGVHGVRPPHLGKKSATADPAVGERVFVPPIIETHLTNLPLNSKGLLLWIIDGHVLSNDELDYLVNLPKLNPKVKVVVEMGGDRVFRWQPLSSSLAA
jgi:NAD(P)H-quinone oxidoreductase subunit N